MAIDAGGGGDGGVNDSCHFRRVAFAITAADATGHPNVHKLCGIAVVVVAALTTVAIAVAVAAVVLLLLLMLLLLLFAFALLYGTIVVVVAAAPVVC